jgi:PIN domain nuclease of toxin-antitoxin system
MNRIVLDASAILAFLQGEPGSEKLTPALLNSAVCGAVNMAEVHGKLVSRGWPEDEAWEDATSPIQQVIPFDLAQARLAGKLVAHTRPLGLSLGDRACLALALTLKAPVYTTEQTWRKLKLQVPVHVIR